MQWKKSDEASQAGNRLRQARSAFKRIADGDGPIRAVEPGAGGRCGRESKFLCCSFVGLARLSNAVESPGRPARRAAGRGEASPRCCVPGLWLWKWNRFQGRDRLRWRRARERHAPILVVGLAGGELGLRRRWGRRLRQRTGVGGRILFCGSSDGIGETAAIGCRALACRTPYPAGGTLVALQHRQQDNVRFLDRQRGVDASGEGFHGLADRRGPLAIDVSVVAADARQLGLNGPRERHAVHGKLEGGLLHRYLGCRIRHVHNGLNGAGAAGGGDGGTTVWVTACGAEGLGLASLPGTRGYTATDTPAMTRKMPFILPMLKRAPQHNDTRTYGVGITPCPASRVRLERVPRGGGERRLDRFWSASSPGDPCGRK